MVKKPTVISLFAGCGGSSLGYKIAGYNELAAVEWWNLAVETFKLNFPRIPVLSQDIKTISSRELMETAGIKPKELDILDASPPCQGFSKSGKYELKDIRNQLIFEVIRLAKDIKPKIIIIENVDSMADRPMNKILVKALAEIKKSGYKVKAAIMDAANYSIPQHRKRLIIIAIRNNINKEISYPALHNKIIPLWKALENCPIENKIYPSGKSHALSILMKPGKDGASVINKNNKFFSHRKCKWNRPAFTLIKSSVRHLIHPDENRPFTIPELKRICSFPDSFKFPSEMSYGNKAGLLANSVPPLLIKVIAEHVKEFIK